MTKMQAIAKMLFASLGLYAFKDAAGFLRYCHLGSSGDKGTFLLMLSYVLFYGYIAYFLIF